MIKCWHFFSQGIRWTPNDGKSINFLFDDWLPSGPLSTAIHGPHSLQDYSLLVADATAFLTSFGELHVQLPPLLDRTIQTTLLLSSQNTSDTFHWKLTPNGSFSLSFAYSMIANTEPNSNWDWLGRLKHFPRSLSSFGFLPTTQFQQELPLLLEAFKFLILAQDAHPLKPHYMLFATVPSSFPFGNLPIFLVLSDLLFHSHSLIGSRSTALRNSFFFGPTLSWSSVFCFLL
ncbi:hypothetical protein SLEP1_g58110 [Rubroshorea leprosula]|uniref:Uncharacterized protein n=1 Tax=Rubroshorea leprosula TaxID=152421 RepID=A0AAV5MPC5_9ROSI|nr:hypothetical protein SLEP1_g58110 [Rubroshorea leprosula]